MSNPVVCVCGSPPNDGRSSYLVPPPTLWPGLNAPPQALCSRTHSARACRIRTPCVCWCLCVVRSGPTKPVTCPVRHCKNMFHGCCHCPLAYEMFGVDFPRFVTMNTWRTYACTLARTLAHESPHTHEHPAPTHPHNKRARPPLARRRNAGREGWRAETNPSAGRTSSPRRFPGGQRPWTPWSPCAAIVATPIPPRRKAALSSRKLGISYGLMCRNNERLRKLFVCCDMQRSKWVKDSVRVIQPLTMARRCNAYRPPTIRSHGSRSRDRCPFRNKAPKYRNQSRAAKPVASAGSMAEKSPRVRETC